jgi:hypothetical protein
MLLECDSPPTPAALPRRRSWLPWVIAVVAVSAAVLLPWSAYLAVTLPASVAARHWPLVWAGLDGAIAAGLGASAWSAWRRARRVVPVSAATATLMAADAWFDVCTSPPGRPLLLALADLAVEATVAGLCLLLARMTRPMAPAQPGI